MVGPPDRNSIMTGAAIVGLLFIHGLLAQYFRLRIDGAG